MFWQVLDADRRDLLKRLAAALPLPGSYLAGGTALALLLGHRMSEDFDWFCPSDFDPGQLGERLRQFGTVEVAETAQGTFHGWINGIKVTWLRYPNPMLAPLVQTADVPGLALASLVDIGLMKWAAVSDRGARKDFIDLYFLAAAGVTVEQLYPLLAQKYPQANINYYHMLKSLTYFDDAEKEVMPMMLTSCDWETVKAYFVRAATALIRVRLDLF